MWQLCVLPGPGMGHLFENLVSSYKSLCVGRVCYLRVSGVLILPERAEEVPRRFGPLVTLSFWFTQNVPFSPEISVLWEVPKIDLRFRCFLFSLLPSIGKGHGVRTNGTVVGWRRAGQVGEPKGTGVRDSTGKRKTTEGNQFGLVLYRDLPRIKKEFITL